MGKRRPLVVLAGILILGYEAMRTGRSGKGSRGSLPFLFANLNFFVLTRPI
jgi:hypothetical protein